MSKEIHQVSSGCSDASSSTDPDQIVYTPQSEDIKHSDNLFTKPPSRRPSPLRSVLTDNSLPCSPPSSLSNRLGNLPKDLKTPGLALDVSDDEQEDMETRSPLHRATDGRSQVPLLKDEHDRPSYEAPNGGGRPALITRRSTFRNRSPDQEGTTATRIKYIYAGFFLVLSLIAFVVQSETAVYIQKNLGWKKAYAML